MRRFFIVPLMILCCLLSGCSATKLEAKDLEFQFDCRADIRYPGGNVLCSFQRTGPENAEIEILSGGPEGLTWSWNGNRFAALYRGLSVESGRCLLPADSFGAAIEHALDQAEKPDALTPTHDNEFSGNAGYDYTLTADPETGKILTLSIPECGIDAEFYDFTQKTIEADLDLDPQPD